MLGEVGDTHTHTHTHRERERERKTPTTCSKLLSLLLKVVT